MSIVIMGFVPYSSDKSVCFVCAQTGRQTAIDMMGLVKAEYPWYLCSLWTRVELLASILMKRISGMSMHNHSSLFYFNTINFSPCLLVVTEDLFCVCFSKRIDISEQKEAVYFSDADGVICFCTNLRCWLVLSFFKWSARELYLSSTHKLSSGMWATSPDTRDPAGVVQ